MSFILHSDVSTLAFNPGYEGLKIGGKILGNKRHFIAGGLYQYIYSQYDTWELPVFLVDLSFRNTINIWWAGNDYLTLVPDYGGSFTVQITNNLLPISKFTIPYDDLFEGVIKLEQSA